MVSKKKKKEVLESWPRRLGKHVLACDRGRTVHGEFGMAYAPTRSLEAGALVFSSPARACEEGTTADRICSKSRQLQGTLVALQGWRWSLGMSHMHGVAFALQKTPLSVVCPHTAADGRHGTTTRQINGWYSFLRNTSPSPLLCYQHCCL